LTTQQIDLGDFSAEVVFKNIKNVHLSVYPPHGRVRIAAPLRMSLDTVRVFAIGKLGWIKKHQQKLLEQDREPPREFLDRESHYVWGKRYLLTLAEAEAAPSIKLRHSRMVLTTRPGVDRDVKFEIMDGWYRTLVKQAAPPQIAKWEALMGVSVSRFFVQRMRTRWGSCSPTTGTIRLNTDLAKKPLDCLEYIIVHEMAHLLEPTHNARFVALMDRFMPTWRHNRETLNRLPVRHEEWGY
jgi:predicted metal-dependent hydrolase